MKSKIIKFLKDIFNLNESQEFEEKIVTSIEKNIEFRGANLFILIFAIFIASIGLNINSIPIIIGAMLISPLMSPIVGVGLSLGIHDLKLLHKSIKNILIATIISIIISTIYFFISPIDNIQSELLARTSPTIYDVMIAFFGGLAGILGSTRMEKSNVIPGVAIATALMPPLCTVGYGLATGQPKFFLGALYLFSINCIFIFLATLIGVRYLKLPKVSFIDKEQVLKTNKIITFLVIVIVIPAIYFAYMFVKENNFNQNVERYVNEVFIDKGYAIIYKDIVYKSNPHKVELAFLAKPFSEQEISNFENLLRQYDLTNTKLVIRQDNANLSPDEWNNVLSNIKSDSDRLKVIEAKLSNSLLSSDNIYAILKEAKTINGKIEKVAIGSLPVAFGEVASLEESETRNVSIAIFYTEQKSGELSDYEKITLTNWIKLRIQNQDIFTFFSSQN